MSPSGEAARGAEPVPERPLKEKGDKFQFPDDYEDERELVRPYYPNLRRSVPPRDWDEPPWGHKEELWPHQRARSTQQ
jgi:hypothetical protein